MAELIIDLIDDDDDAVSELILKRPREEEEDEPAEKRRKLQDAAARLAKNERARERAAEKRRRQLLARPLAVDSTGAKGMEAVGCDIALKTLGLAKVRVTGYQLKENLHPATPEERNALLADDANLVPIIDRSALRLAIFNVLDPARAADRASSEFGGVDASGGIPLATCTRTLMLPEARDASDGKTKAEARQAKNAFKWRNKNKNMNYSLNVRWRFLHWKMADMMAEWDWVFQPSRTLFGTLEWPDFVSEVQPAPVMQKVDRELRFAVLGHDALIKRLSGITEPAEPREIIPRAGKGLARGTLTYEGRKKAAWHVTQEILTWCGCADILDMLDAMLVGQGLDPRKKDDVADAFLLALRRAMDKYNAWVKYQGKIFYSGRTVRPTQVQYRYVEYADLVAGIPITEGVLARRKPVRKTTTKRT